MSLEALIGDVLDLQARYSYVNTSDMDLRGQIIRDRIPAALRLRSAELVTHMAVPSSDLFVEGGDGTGRKSEIPWVRLASRIYSPAATQGWYVVWLFRKDGKGVYLALAHGSTELKGGSFVPRPDGDLAALMTWAKGILGKVEALPNYVADVDLSSGGTLATAYEKSCVAACYYPREELPSESQLFHDQAVLVSLLGKLYAAEKLGQSPVSVNPEVRDAISAAEAISRPMGRKQAQGFGLSTAERKAVEMCAMRRATERLQELGFEVQDVSQKSSYDLHATRGDESHCVEVKGTTGGLGAILLTANEVELHKAGFPANALIVVHSITLINVTEKLSTFGGELRMWMPWAVDDSRLNPISYAYRLDGS